jgi:hypothetical protein
MEPAPLKLLEPILTQRMEAHRRDAILWSPQTKKNDFVKPGNITPVFYTCKILFKEIKKEC